MINKININNFKSHKDTTLYLSNLTVLCGANGVGKSSAIQLLLLLRDTYMKDKSFDNLDLKPKSVKVGTFYDALYQSEDANSFSIEIVNNNQANLFCYEAIKESEKSKSFVKLNVTKSSIDLANIPDISVFNTNFQYLSAYRLGPQVQYPKDDKIVDIYRQISENDGSAEYFVHFLDRYCNIDCISEVRIGGFSDLLSQVIAWERSISQGINISINDVGKLGYVLKYSFDKGKGKLKTRPFEATNVGFGLTYVMPILVAILSAQKDALIIIENPEAHLSPNGIAKLTELICIAAQAGIQIILETHSDHVINGVLVQSKKFEQNEKGISRQHVNIYHFDKNIQEQCTQCTKIDIQESGKIVYPPKGFFDQFTIDRKFLIGF